FWASVTTGAFSLLNHRNSVKVMVMRTIFSIGGAGLLSLALFACAAPPDGKAPSTKSPPEKKAPPEKAGPVKKIEIAKNVTVEIEGPKAEKRRVVIDAFVCNRECPLEMLLTIKHRKEHEAVRAADSDAFKQHPALILAGAD